MVQSKAEKEKDRRLLLKLLIALLIVILLSSLRQCGNSLKYSDPIEPGVINLPRKVDVQQYVNEKVDYGMFQVFMNTDIKIASDGTANLLIQNTKENHYAAIVEIYKDSERIYKSGPIQPGYKLEYDNLDKEVEPGNYNCTAYFHVMDQNNIAINKIGLNVKIERLTIKSQGKK